MSGFENLKSALAEREAAGLLRQRRIAGSAQGRELNIDGHRLINFCSNDYLGLASDPRVVGAFKSGADQWGVGSGASHLITGHTKAHHELEIALAEFTGRERCLLYATGYAANLGTIAALLESGDYVFEDRLNHASLLDGGRLSGARFSRYRHRDLADLAGKLARAASAAGRKLVVSDGTFSMDGTTCDVPATAQLAAEHDAWVMIDEAHSLGVLGEQGRGLVAPAANGDTVQVLIGTLGKAFGTVGGFVAGSAELIDTLIQHARPYIYSTALPAAAAVATLTSLQIAQQEDWRRERLNELIGTFRERAAKLGYHLLDSHTPIQPLVVGSTTAALELSAALEAEGLLATAIRPPTVPRDSARIRLTFTAAHTDADLNQLLGALERCQA